jgi:hypothetical protein
MMRHRRNSGLSDVIRTRGKTAQEVSGGKVGEEQSDVEHLARAMAS